MRELENVLERAVALETTEAVLPERLPESSARPGRRPGDAAAIGAGFSLDEHLLAIERGLLSEALGSGRGGPGGAAELLGVTPRSLRYLIQKHALPSARDKNCRP